MLPQTGGATINVRHVLVLGAGQMGTGIAQVFAQAGFTVMLCDTQAAVLQRATATMTHSLQKLYDKQQLKEPVNTVLDRVACMQNAFAAVPQADLVLEAIVEDLAAKQALWQSLASTLTPAHLVATNTSSLSITLLAQSTPYPERFMGMHFMNPVPLMPLVELIAGAKTAPDVVQAISALVTVLDKTPVHSKDFPGFISNRVLMPLINEAIYALHEGVGTAEAIDQVMQLGMRHPMGPLKLADFIGLDTVRAILMILSQGFGEARFRPCPLLTQYVQAGWLGCKTGQGFYRYP